MAILARFLLTSLAGLLALVLSTSIAAACSCAGLTPAEYVAQADVVARGIIERIVVPDEKGRNAGEPAVYTVRPTHAWKGDVTDTLTVETSPSGASCGLEFLPEGLDIVLFATFEGDSLTAGLCGGTAAADEVLIAEVTGVLGVGTPVEVDPSDDEEPGCDCTDKSTAQHAADADLIARVIVELVNEPVAGAPENQPTTYTLRPTYVWKGTVVSQFKVTSERSGSECGLEGITEGSDLVVFANEVADGWSANLCGGTAPATEELVVELREAVGPGVAPDTDPGDRPGDWIWPTVAAAVSVLIVGSIIVWWWVRPRKLV
ncbi:MAG: hypothetical protein Q4P15_09880 [Propionibacteriaceae bacterium]|nr:hypothetical protein [Propionibacteriaceae bacterium]